MRKPHQTLSGLMKVNVETNYGLVAKLKLALTKWVIVLFVNMTFWILLSLVFQALEGGHEASYKCGG